jgi:DNA-binding Lrp family transcriptional regulator
MPTQSKNSAEVDSAQSWTFFTNHTHVLVYLSIHGSAPLRDVAAAIGITERGVQRIVKELEESGVLSRERIGRNNRYKLHSDVSLRHPLESHCTIGQILSVILKGARKRS